MTPASATCPILITRFDAVTAPRPPMSGPLHARTIAGRFSGNEGAATPLVGRALYALPRCNTGAPSGFIAAQPQPSRQPAQAASVESSLGGVADRPRHFGIR